MSASLELMCLSFGLSFKLDGPSSPFDLPHILHTEEEPILFLVQRWQVHFWEDYGKGIRYEQRGSLIDFYEFGLKCG